MQAVVNGLLTSYESRGNGKQTILLMPGWGDSLATFRGLQTELAKKFTTVSVDLPGFGASAAPQQVWGLDEYAQFVDSFLKKIGVKRPHVIIGHSNGGAVAIRGLSQNTLTTDKLVLIGSAGIRDQQKGKKTALKIIAKTGKAVTFWLPTRTKQKLRQKLYTAAGSDMFVVPHLEETFKKTVSQDVQTDAKKLTAPTLLIYGDQDTSTPPVYGEIFHNHINGSTLEVIANAGHFVHHDQPETVAKLITEFIDA
jgi:pimeloyl-ACP methyl ester carboxylesterase